MVDAATAAAVAPMFGDAGLKALGAAIAIAGTGIGIRMGRKGYWFCSNWCNGRE